MDEIQRIFSDLDEIIPVNAAFLAELEDLNAREDMPVSERGWGMAFAQLVSSRLYFCYRTRSQGLFLFAPPGKIIHAVWSPRWKLSTIVKTPRYIASNWCELELQLVRAFNSYSLLRE